MPSYFRQVPNFEYVSRTNDAQSISEFITVKNLFKRGKLREDIFGDLTFFTKYKIVGDSRPDNVAHQVYGDETLDWIVLLSNNIVNIQTEWPLSQQSFHNFLLNKYGTESAIQSVHHYETMEVTTSTGEVMVPSGLEVLPDYSITFYDAGLNASVTRSDITDAVTNYEYEEKKEDAKRNIFLLKQDYLNLILNDMEEIMPYKKGSTQYVSETLVKGENIRLYS